MESEVEVEFEEVRGSRSRSSKRAMGSVEVKGRGCCKEI